jgi:hypothetical protein
MKAIYLRPWLLVVGAVACVSGVAGSASAITLPPGYGYDISQRATVRADGTPVGDQQSTTVGSVSASESSPVGTIGPGATSASGSIAITPSPKISGTASASFTTPPSIYNTHDGDYGSNGGYSGVLVYYFEIAGPTSSVAVNAKAVGSYSTTALPSGGEVEALINFNLIQLDSLGDQVSPWVIRDTAGFNAASFSSGTAASSGGFTENGTYNLFTNTIYQVALQIIANVGILNAGASDPSSPGGTASVFASLDPTFQVASGVDPSQYSFAFSDGIGNTAAVSTTPLPAGLPLFATGLGALGLFGARRKRKNA